MTADLRWGRASDPGRIRQQNEDSVLVEDNLFAVADGMGGHKAGEVASALTVELLKRRLGDTTSSLDDVLSAVVDANGEIFTAATANIDQQGMGTTLTGLFVVTAATADGDNLADGSTDAAPRQRFALINVGDSRTYLLRHDRLRRVTMDHNYVQELVNTGLITDDEARTHPRRNIITRALGIDPTVRVDAWTLPIVRGDRFVLCSDGLSDEIHDSQIHQIVSTITDPQLAADELVAAANRSGGRDNISVVVVDVLEGDDPPAPDEELDIEPVWQRDDASTTWAIDDASSEPEAFDDLAALANTQGVKLATPPSNPRVVTAQIPAVGQPRRHRGLVGFLIAVAVIGIIVVGFVIAAAYARRSYYVAFDDQRSGGGVQGPEGRLPVVGADERGQLALRPRAARRPVDRARRAPADVPVARRRPGVPPGPAVDHHDHHDDHDDHDDDHHHDDDLHDGAAHHHDGRRARRVGRDDEPHLGADDHDAVALGGVMATTSPSPGLGDRPSCRSS